MNKQYGTFCSFEFTKGRFEAFFKCTFISHISLAINCLFSFKLLIYTSWLKEHSENGIILDGTNWVCINILPLFPILYHCFTISPLSNLDISILILLSSVILSLSITYISKISDNDLTSKLKY